MEKKQSEFNKVFSAWDILVIAFGAMIGWAGSSPRAAGSRRAASSARRSALWSAAS